MISSGNEKNERSDAAANLNQSNGASSLEDGDMDYQAQENPFVRYYGKMLEDVIHEEKKKRVQKQGGENAETGGTVSGRATSSGLDTGTVTLGGIGGEGKQMVGENLFANQFNTDYLHDYDQGDFFLKLIQTFDLINYYNLIIL